MILSLIAAASENGVVGVDNRLPWNLPGELKRFREITRGHPVIMGRKTHESIGRALPDRLNVVVTRRGDARFPGCETAASLEDAIEIAARTEADEAFVIGGGELYALALPRADRVDLTRVHAEIAGDTRFPDLPQGEWVEMAREFHPASDVDPIAYTCLTYERRR